jgi:FkbM family methyltransferase
MIVNRLDQSVSAGLFLQGHEYDVEALANILVHRRTIVGDGFIVLDVGANIGAYTVAWASLMRGWGKVIAFEPQERIFYALAGNIALNNCFNARAMWAAISDVAGTIDVPRVDYRHPCDCGGVALSGPRQLRLPFTDEVPCIKIDDLGLSRVDLLKVDVEGMEPNVLRGAVNTISRCHPIMYIEHFICGENAIREVIPGYRCIVAGQNLLAMPEDDPLWERMPQETL